MNRKTEHILLYILGWSSQVVFISFTKTDLEASRWLSRQVPRRYSGSSSGVLACLTNTLSFRNEQQSLKSSLEFYTFRHSTIGSFFYGNQQIVHTTIHDHTAQFNKIEEYFLHLKFSVCNNFF